MTERGETIFIVFLMLIGFLGMLYACSVEVRAFPRLDDPFEIARPR